MSYEGYEVYLCRNKHMYTENANMFCSEDNEGDSDLCPYCNAPPAYNCSVDTTNGYDENDPSSHEPTVEEVGFTDIWKEDHYGNKYAVKLMHYKPVTGFGMNKWYAYTKEGRRVLIGSY